MCVYHTILCITMLYDSPVYTHICAYKTRFIMIHLRPSRPDSISQAATPWRPAPGAGRAHPWLPRPPGSGDFMGFPGLDEGNNGKIYGNLMEKKGKNLNRVDGTD